MNTGAFLTCFNSSGIETGISIFGLYSFSSGTSSAIYNQFYSTGYNIYNNLPYAPALPLIFVGTGNQTSGIFSNKQIYQVGTGLPSLFSAIFSLNYSGCLNNQNKNYLLASTVFDYNSSNSGVSVGITPSNRLFFNTKNYSYTIPQEIGLGDFAYLSVQSNRFVNLGLFNLKDNSFNQKSYDAGDSTIDSSQLFIGGMKNYPSNFTGYSGAIKEIYLFSGSLSTNLINSCVDCSFATGFSYVPIQSGYYSSQITGSYWTGIYETGITGYQNVSIPYVKQDGTTGSIYVSSGLTGAILSYNNLVAQTQDVQYIISGTGTSIQFDTGTRANYSAFDLYLDQGLVSGDVVEIYTYPTSNTNIELSILNNTYPIVNGEAQIYGNGLAETNGVDYTVGFNNLINGFDNNDILLYDIYPYTLTMPYQSGYVSTGVSGAGYISITGISGINLSSGFNYDFYLNGQKMISGLNYTSSGSTLRVSGNDLSDINDPYQDYLEAKFIPIYSGFLRNLYQISTTQSYISGVLGFNQQIWVNGLRQKLNIDYYKYSRCRFCSGNFNDPNYQFILYNNTSSTLNLFNLYDLDSIVFGFDGQPLLDISGQFIYF
jgi:hypothetical protein